MCDLLWNNVVLATPSVWRTNTEVILSILPGVCWSVSVSQWKNVCVVKIKLNTEFEDGCGQTLLNMQSTFALLDLFYWGLVNWNQIILLSHSWADLLRSCHGPLIVLWVIFLELWLLHDAEWEREREREREKARQEEDEVRLGQN